VDEAWDNDDEDNDDAVEAQVEAGTPVWDAPDVPAAWAVPVDADAPAHWTPIMTWQFETLTLPSSWPADAFALPPGVAHDDCERVAIGFPFVHLFGDAFRV
jgi:hypothetical protein